MDDALYGQRDKRGNWKPFKRVMYPAVFVWPVQPLAILQWLFSYPGYILPWNLLYAAIDPRLRLDRARLGTAGG